MIRTDLEPEEDRTIALAIGRILRLGGRPARPGDVAEYERCRSIILGILDPVGLDWTPDRPFETSYPRDHRKGAQGD